MVATCARGWFSAQGRFGHYLLLSNIYLILRVLLGVLFTFTSFVIKLEKEQRKPKHMSVLRVQSLLPFSSSAFSFYNKARTYKEELYSP